MIQMIKEENKETYGGVTNPNLQFDPDNTEVNTLVINSQNVFTKLAPLQLVAQYVAVPAQV